MLKKLLSKLSRKKDSSCSNCGEKCKSCSPKKVVKKTVKKVVKKVTKKVAKKRK